MAELKGKQTSLAGKIVACVYVVSMSTLNLVLNRGWAVRDIVIAGAFLLVAFAPIDISKWLDKFVGRGE